MCNLRALRLISLSCLPLLLVLAACDSWGETEETIENQFRLEINEASSDGQSTLLAAKAQRELNGFSFFAEGTDPETGESAFGLYFDDSESFGTQSAQEGLFGIAVRPGGRPSAGNYPVDTSEAAISSGNAVAMFLFENVDDVQQGASFYLGTGGTIGVDASSDRQVGGTINVSALRVQIQVDTTTYEVVSDTTNVEITGEFTARNADTFLPAGVTPDTGLD